MIKVRYVINTISNKLHSIISDIRTMTSLARCLLTVLTLYWD